MIKWAKSQLNRNRRSRKAISVIMANLTMLVIVVALSSLLFVWAVSSFGAYQGGAGYWFSSKSLANQERLSIENVYFNGSSRQFVNVFYRNVGPIPVTVAAIYFSSSSFSVSRQYSTLTQLGVGNVAAKSINLVADGKAWDSGTLYTIELATIRGTTITTTWVA